MPNFLNYAQPQAKKLEWQFIRSTFGIMLFVLGWLGFSLYVWHLFGDLGVGVRPNIRILRDLCAPRVIFGTVLMTALNILYLVVRLRLCAKSVIAWPMYLAIALVPLFSLTAIEWRFDSFLVE